MAGGGPRRISAASARAHTRKHRKSGYALPPGLFKKISLVLLVGLLSWAYQALRPPAPKICGSPNGPAVTSARIKLKDGRSLAYRENGVAKANAKYKIVYSHPFDSCRHDVLPISTEVIEELRIYLLTFDRPGYGESDPNPKRTENGIALDIEELADQLEVGSTFYVIGFSMGGQAVWGCLKYIPRRLAGAALIAPVVNYWWPRFPANLSKEAYSQQPVQDQWAVRVAHYLPWLTYWWNTQKWFASSAVVKKIPKIFSPADLKLLPKIMEGIKQHQSQITQQGLHETFHRDMIVGFGNWKFDPMDLSDPFSHGKGSVHLWHGDEDGIVPVLLQRYIAKKLPWIHYHEIAGAGHLFPHADGMTDAIVKSLLLGE